MPRRPAPPHRHVYHSGALSLLLLLALTRTGAAQVTEPTLTPEMIRKVSAVMKDWNPLPGMGARLYGAAATMPREKFEALPKAEQERLMAEGMAQAEAKNKEGERQISRLLTGTLADRAAVVKSIPELSAAISRSGLSTNDFLPAFMAYHRALSYVLSEEGFPDSVKPLPPGVRKTNVDLMRPMLQAESLWNPIG